MNDRFENFVGVVYALNKEVQRIKSEKMGSLGQRGTDTMVLYYLGQSDAGFSEAELARLIHQDRAAVTRTVAKLEREGLVHRASGGETGAGRYRAPVRLTELGQGIALEMDQIIDDVVRQASADLSPDERSRLYGWLAQILSRLEEIRG
jgi:DNA-binding MarR family transcriptional regulator